MEITRCVDIKPFFSHSIRKENKNAKRQTYGYHADFSCALLSCHGM